ncbi:MAG: hypothetical protein JXL97_08440 [Bacteroidales bacterium]|nr:hypothetical protein [Bacteroidales bacterium]MBN2891880.1 hypothetical protein [Bacteroidales bacterium]
MKFQFYYEKLLASDKYLSFKKEHPKAYPCSGFFALDLENLGKNNQVHFDFWLPDVEKMYSFKVSGPVEFVNVENFDKRAFEKLSMNYTFDLEEVMKVIQSKMDDEKIKGKMKKLLFSLQKMNGVDYLLATVFLDNMAMLKATYDIADKRITDIEKKSFLDIFKIIKK